MKKMSAMKMALAMVLIGEGEETFTKEQYETALAAAATAAAEKAAKEKDEEYKGVVKKNAELLATLTGATDKLKKVEGVDIEGLLKLRETIENDEILKLASQGKHSEAIDKATEKLRVTHQTELEALIAQNKKMQEDGQSDKALIDKLLIDGGAQSAFVKAKGLETAIDDIALLARTVWKVEAGELVARGADGEMLKGEKGPITMAEWVELQKVNKPHLFPASETAGAKGGKGTNVDTSDIDAQIVAASKRSDIPEMRRLKKLKAEGKK